MAPKNPYSRRARAVKHEDDGKIITLDSAQTSLPAPAAAGSGGDISGWADDQGYMPDEVDLLLTAANTVNITSPVLYEKIGSVWYATEKLRVNDGQQIDLTSSVGAKLSVKGIVGSRLKLGGTLSGAVAVTVKAVPKRVVTD